MDAGRGSTGAGGAAFYWRWRSWPNGVSLPRISLLAPLRPRAMRNRRHRYRERVREVARQKQQRPGAAAGLDNSRKPRMIARVCDEPPRRPGPLRSAGGGRNPALSYAQLRPQILEKPALAQPGWRFPWHQIRAK
jgi:hypothetical protein